MLPRFLIFRTVHSASSCKWSLFRSTTILTVLTRLRHVYYLYKSLCRNTTKLPLHVSYTERKHNAIRGNNDVIYCRITLSLPRMQITVLQRYIFHARIVKWNPFKKMGRWIMLEMEVNENNNFFWILSEILEKYIIAIIAQCSKMLNRR